MYTRPPASIVSVPTPDGRSVVYISERPVTVGGWTLPPHTRVYFERMTRRGQPLGFVMRRTDLPTRHLATFLTLDALRTFIEETGLDILVVVNS